MCRVKKGVHCRSRRVSKTHAEMILRVKLYFEEEKWKGKAINLNKLLERTSEATGFSRAIVNRIKTQDDVDNWKYDDGDAVSTPRDSSIPENFSSLVRHAVRSVILEKKKNTTLDSVFEKLKSITASEVDHLNLFSVENMPDPTEIIWKWSRSTLYRFMLKNGFIHDDRVTHYEYTKTRKDVVAMRDNYLEWISKYRSEGYFIFYQDETWVFKNMAPKKIWKDTQGDLTQEQPRKPSGSGERSILSHVCCENIGLLNGCMLLFRGEKSNKDSDYHTEMNWAVFSDWCRNKVFPAIERTGQKSVIVLDRASYHTKLDDEDRRPVQSWNKTRLIDSILRWGGVPISWPSEWKTKKTKSQLLEYAKKIYPNPKYKIQKIADEFTSGEFHIKVLFLPVAHPELNPIELVWSSIKRHVSSNNVHFRLTEVERLTKEKIATFTSEEIKKFTLHAIKEEEEYRKMSSIGDEYEDPDATETDSTCSEGE